MDKQDRIQSIKEMIAIDTHLISNKKALIRDFDKRCLEFKAEITAMEAKLAELIAEHDTAPADLRKYQANKIRNVKKLADLKAETSTVLKAKKRAAVLKAKIAKLEKELAEEAEK
jgi:hypothetical protein